MATTARDEAIRKSLHLLLSLIAAAVVWWLPAIPAATILAGATFAALTVELARRTSGPFARGFQRVLGPLLRDRETRGLTGATTLAIGFTVAVVLLPGVPAVAGILVAGVADALAAFIGKRLGRIRYPGGKSLEGSAAFFIAVLAIALALPGLSPATAAALALAVTLLEAPTLPVDDNLYLPLATALAVQVAGLLTGVAFFS